MAVSCKSDCCYEGAAEEPSAERQKKLVHDALLDHKKMLMRHEQLFHNHNCKMSQFFAAVVKVEAEMAVHKQRINGLCDAVALLQVQLETMRARVAPVLESRKKERVADAADAEPLPAPADLLDITCDLSDDADAQEHV
jgi:hypothetical protein